MLSFRQLREKKLKGMPPGEHVWDKKIKGVLTKIAKMGKKMFASLMNFFGVQIGSATGIPGSIEL